MTDIYRSKLLNFHSEIRKKDIERRMNSKRYLLSKYHFFNEKLPSKKKTLVLDENYLNMINNQLEVFLRNGKYDNLYENILNIRENYIYDKNNMKMIKIILNNLIDLSLMPNIFRENEKLCYECTWILINFIGLENSNIEVSLLDKLFQIFIKQMNSDKNEKFQKEGLWGLANLLADPYFQNPSILKRYSVMNIFLNYYQKNDLDNETLKLFLWCICNIISNEYFYEETESNKIFYIISEIFIKYELCVNSWKKCLKLFLILLLKIHHNDAQLQNIVEKNLASLKYIIKILKTQESNTIISLGMKIFLLISTGNNNTTQILFEIGILEILKNFIATISDLSIHENVFCILSNLSASCPNQIQILLDDKKFFSSIFFNALTGETKIKYNCFLVLLHISIVGNIEQIRQLVDMGIIEILCLNFECEDIKILEYLLEALDNICFYGDFLMNSENLIENPYVKCFEELGGITVLAKKDINQFPEEIWLKIENLYEKYF